MISPLSFEIETEPSWYTKADIERSRTIRDQYPKSGLYLNDGSNKPLWDYGGEWLRPVIVAPDGEHLVIPGEWINDDYSSRAVTFFQRDQVIRTYWDREIIPHYFLKAVVNGWSPPSCSDAWFEPERMTYTIRTNQHEEIVFDVISGAIIEVRSPFPTFYAVASVIFVACATPIVRRLWKRMRRKAA